MSVGDKASKLEQNLEHIRDGIKSLKEVDFPTAEENQKLVKLIKKEDRTVAEIAAAKRIHDEYQKVRDERGGVRNYTHGHIAKKFNCTRATITNRLNGHLALNRQWLLRLCSEFNCDPATIYPELVESDPSIVNAIDAELLSSIEGLSFEEKKLYRELVDALSGCSDDFRDSIISLIKAGKH